MRLLLLAAATLTTRGRPLRVLGSASHQDAGRHPDTHRHQARFDVCAFPSGVDPPPLTTDAGVAAGRMTRLR